jgi:hypothetical protein
MHFRWHNTWPNCLAKPSSYFPMLRAEISEIFCINHLQWRWYYYAWLSYSSSGLGAYAPDAQQPVGSLCYPCTALVF